MPRTQETWSAEPAGTPRPVGRHVEWPIKVFELDGREVIFTMSASRAKRHLRALARAVAIAEERESQPESPDSNERGDGDEQLA